MADGSKKLDLSLVWDGDGRNPNAALTVFRHFDSASVVKGLVGEPPKTAWVIGYPLFERIYYLLVAGYDVFGNVGHQLNSRLYMDFMRMEGEFNFLLFLPPALRQPTAASWYQGAPDEAKEYVYGPNNAVDFPPTIAYRTADPQRELYDLLRKRLAPALDTRHDLSRVSDPRLRSALQSLATVRGASLSWWPEMVVLQVDRAAGAPQYFSLLRDTAHANVAHLVREAANLVPADNRLTVVPGLLGAYPNAIYRVSERDLPALETAIRGLASEADYRALADRFAIRRTSPAFWAASDALHEAYRAVGTAGGRAAGLQPAREPLSRRRARHLRTVPAHANLYAGATCSTSLPKFSPLKSLSSVSGKAATPRRPRLPCSSCGRPSGSRPSRRSPGGSGRRSRTRRCLPCARGSPAATGSSSGPAPRWCCCTG